MKQLFYSLLLTVVFMACNNTSKNLGQTFTPENPISVNDVISQLTTKEQLKDIQIEGIVEKSCKGEGCWFTIKDANGEEIVFDVADKKFRVPTNSPGKTVIVLADATQDTTSDQKIALSVKGLMFK